MNEKEIINKSMEFSKEPIEKNSIMFIEKYSDGGNQGTITQLFFEFLTNPLYSSYKLIWVARDYELTVKRFADLINSSRIWIVFNEGHDYVKYLNVAETIFFGDLLPNYYIKKEGQKVYSVLNEAVAVRDYYNRRMLNKCIPSINKSDKIIIEKGMIGTDDFIERFDISQEKIQYYEHLDILKGYYIGKFIFITLQDNKRAVKDISVFEYIYDILYGIAEAYGYAIKWQVSLRMYRMIQEDERVRNKLKNIFSNESDCTPLIRSAELVISDTVTNAFRAVRYNKKTILFYDKNIEDANRNALKGVRYVNDFENLINFIEGEFGGDTELTSYIDLNKRPILFECPEILQGDGFSEIIMPIIKKTLERRVKPDKDLPKILFVLGWTGKGELNKGLNNLVDSYRGIADITVVYRSTMGGALYKDLNSMSTSVKYYIRNGDVHCSEYENSLLITDEWVTLDEVKKSPVLKEQLYEVIKIEWQRMLGNITYDYMICLKSTHRFWNSLYLNPPVKDMTYYEQSDADTVIKYLKQKTDEYLEKNR